MGYISWAVAAICFLIAGALFFSVNTVALRIFSRVKLLEALKEANKEAALAAAVIHSEYYKSRVKSTPEIDLNWKNKLGSS